jgi:hypothetical protein
MRRGRIKKDGKGFIATDLIVAFQIFECIKHDET